MRKIYKHLLGAVASVAVFGMVSCAEDHSGNEYSQGALLKLSAGFAPMTRVSELTDVGQMTETGTDGLSNIGLYVYYTDDYNKGDLSSPYIRNMECTVSGGEVLAVLGAGANEADSRIFIFDRMTVVAFYPYNPDMSLPENYFSVKLDEENYPITKADYGQRYIPYRAQAETDPTRSFYTLLTFYPKHTYKVEIILVSKDGSEFPDENGLKILPDIDPVGSADVTSDDSRQLWYEPSMNLSLPDTGGGSYVNRYTAYFWTRNGRADNNNIDRGEVLVESNGLTLIASKDVYVQEQYVYRYGYNLTTGEMFIPTSSNLIHDAASLAGVNNSAGDAYQVCDIDLSVSGNWTPINIYGGRYDGGGHRITGLTVDTDQQMGGLFGQIKGNATVCNIDLVSPSITVNNTTGPNTYAGAIAGRLNNVLTDAEKENLIGGLPDGLSEVVREAILAELLEALGSTTARIVACKVEDPVISVTGPAPMVGTITGQAGDKSQAGDSMSQIWDTYSTGGSITVNSGNPAFNAGGYAGGFVGLNNGYITRSFTTVPQVDFDVPATNPTDPAVDASTGFATMGDDFTAAEGGNIENSFSVLADSNAGVQQMPGAWPSNWASYNGIWPIITTGWLSSPANSFWYSNGTPPSTYPTLQWERK